MPHWVDIRTPGKTLPDSTTQLNPPVHRRALVVTGNRQVRRSDGEVVVSTALVVIDPGLHVPTGSQVTCHPGTAGEFTSPVIAVSGATVPGTPSNLNLHLE